MVVFREERITMALGTRFTLPGRLLAHLLAGCAVVLFLAPTAGAQPDSRDALFKDTVLLLGGQACEEHLVEAESALLRLRGVVMVDVERRKGYVVVGYDSSRVSVAQLLNAIRSRRGTDWFCTAQVVSE